MDTFSALLEHLTHFSLLSQSGQEQYESGRMWYRIGALLVAIAGLVGGLGLIFYKDKKGEATDPRVLLFAKILGVIILIGGLGIAIYMFSTT